MWFILGVFFSISVHALAPNEKLSGAKILRALPNNIIMINRGLEDGILKNDHAKFSTDFQEFSSRGICIKVNTESSYWKLYRIPYSESFSKDFSYTLVGLAKEIPYPVIKTRDQFFEIPDESQKSDSSLEPDPFLIKRDLPEKLTERDLLKPDFLNERETIIEKEISQERLKRDFRHFKLSFFASPFTRQSINEGETLRYGIRAENEATKYKLNFQYEQQENKLRDPLTREEVQSKGTLGQVQFIIRDLSKKISSLSLLDYRSQSFSRLGTPDAHWLFGPLGFTWHIYESKTWEYLNLSYIPLFDKRTTEFINTNGTLETQKDDGLRHGFRLGFKTNINQNVALENLLWVRPYQDTASWDIDSQDLYLSNDLKLIFSLTENLFFDYSFAYVRDEVWSRINDLPETNTINSINIRYDLNL